MDRKTFIESYCLIKNGKITYNNAELFESEKSFFEFSKRAYHKLGINYAKFFKMDNLSKLCFLASEIIMKDNADPNTALLFANSASSLDTDVKHQQSIEDKNNYFPSPAVFVYTLPNICLGEISIRHQLHSENSFFIFDAFNPAFMTAYANVLLLTEKADKVLCGWVEYFGENYEAFAYLVSKEGHISHDQQTLDILYNKQWKH